MGWVADPGRSSPLPSRRASVPRGLQPLPDAVRSTTIASGGGLCRVQGNSRLHQIAAPRSSSHTHASGEKVLLIELRKLFIENIQYP